MSVISELTIFPLGHESGLGKYVKRVISRISEFGYPYTVTAMGTIFETSDLQQALDVVKASYDVLEVDSDRVYLTVKFDISKQGTQRMQSKLASVREDV